MKTILLLPLFMLLYLSGGAQTKPAYLNAGSKAMDEGDYYTAGLLFSKALEFNEADASVIYRLADACRLYNDYKNALANYEKYLELDERHKKPLAIFYAGEMKKYLGDYTGAKKFFQEYSKMHVQDTGFYSLKSNYEIASCDSAISLLNDTLNVIISSAGNTINTIYNDFAGQQLGDSVIYFSSQRFEESDRENKKKKRYISKVLKSSKQESYWQTPAAIDRLFNPSGYLNCNSSISADHRYMFFTRCAPITISSYHGELFFSKWEKGKWQSPVKLGKEINNTAYSNTQPAIANDGPFGYLLYFSSDRPGGYGGQDLWKSSFSNGQFSKPENLGPLINTAGDEITPFFDNLSGTLYFSSNWHYGLGGYDIFKSVLTNGILNSPVNLGFPYNSSCNDIYFSVTETGKKGLLTSNRPGSMYLYTQTCCYDIYRYEVPETIEKTKDSIADHVAEVKQEILLRNADSTELTVFLPLKLYFDNDQPGRKSLDTVTSRTYEETYFKYKALKSEYLYAFHGQPNKDSMQAAVLDFFQNTLDSSYQNLARFSSSLLRVLKIGRTIHITIQGCASPLAKDDYNKNLSKRRISSLLNYLKVYENGQLASYIENNNLIISEDPAGESLSRKEVSDNLQDKRNSVYHPLACLERRIEVISIKFID